MKERLKSILFRLLGKDPEGVVVSFVTGDPELAARMIEEVRSLAPDRRHYVVAIGDAPRIAGATVMELAAADAGGLWLQLRRAFRGLRVALAPVLFTGEPSPLQLAALALAPRKILAYNARLERHHLRLSTWIASLLFLRGVALDRIWLRPWKKGASRFPASYRLIEGRPPVPGRRRIAILSPYFPYPLSHGGAVRIFHLLREASRDFDLYLFAFTEEVHEEDLKPVLGLCAAVVIAGMPYYREPRWSTLLPPEVCEFSGGVMREALVKLRRERSIELVQVEYTYLAAYGGDVLVEHDVTYDLHEQVRRARPSLSNWWNWWRWRRFETRAVRSFPRVVVMSEKDRALLGAAHARVIPNGVDLERFHPAPEQPGQRVLFVGSFRHFPNITAYRFFTEEVWPLLRERLPAMALTVVAGPDPMLHWREHTRTLAPAPDHRIRLLGLVRDVRPLYVECSLVVVPTTVSAGTNLKVLEAMAMERAIVSTPSGCAGLGLEHGKNVWIARDTPSFAEAVSLLARDPDLRRRLAVAARAHAERHFDWKALGRLQADVWRELLPSGPFRVRPARQDDLAAIGRIQEASLPASQWEPQNYLAYETWVAEAAGGVAGFLAIRQTGSDEHELLNLAVDPSFRRQGIASALLRHTIAAYRGALFLEVRESNHAARNLYQKLGFSEAGRRPEYYEHPPETAIVMKNHSW